jgi:hypothetical protein
MTVQEFSAWIVILGAVLGGMWKLGGLLVARAGHTAVDLGVVTTFGARRGTLPVVFVEVTLTNRGRTKVEAKRGQSESGYAFEDANGGPERLRFSGSLQLRRAPAGNTEVAPGWFDPALQSIEGLGELDLLEEYRLPPHPSSRRDGEVEFWMEPGESYRLGRILLLRPGSYVGKVTFIAHRWPWLPAGRDGNFWSRVFHFEVPAAGHEGQERAL